MSFLSSLLNPEPAGEGSQPPTEAQKNSSLPATQHDGQQPQVYPGMQQPLEHGAAPPAMAHDFAQALHTLSTSNSQPPDSWPTWNGARRPSTTEVKPDVRTESVTRRLSVYGDNTSPIELPQPPEVARKMSSPTLDQYHVASRSPDQHRRPSYADHALTLPPIHAVADQPTHSSVGQDSSVIVQDEHEKEQVQPQVVDTTTEMQHVAEHREPDYTREEPTTTQIRRPSSLNLEIPTQQDSTPSLDVIKPDSDMTGTTSRAHSPLTNLKHEHSAHTHSPLRESSVPVPSTEMPAPATSSTVPRKRPPPKSAVKKGTASSVKKEPAAKKRKTDSVAAAAAKRSGTPSSHKSKSALAGAKKLGSGSGTPLNSSPAPRSARSVSTPPRSVTSAEADGEAQYSEDEDEDEDQGTPDPDAELYCLCRRPDTGTFMIGCDGGCDDWFHGKCVGIAERDKGLIDRYVCPRCTDKGLGPTTWKRMCRRHGCRLPARTPGSATAKKGKKETNTSKYCSDACALQYFKDLVAKTRGAADRSKSKKNAAGDDLGPRGGVLSASELKALVSVASGVDEFKRFGEGILSPPATPSHATPDLASTSQHIIFTDAEQERVSEIVMQKDAARKKHGILKDRLKFITMLKQTATTLAEDRNLKPKEFCGFDTRMMWTDEEFDAWRTTPEAKEGLRTGIMPASMAAHAPAIDADGDTGMTNGEEAEGAEDGQPSSGAGGAGAGDLCDKKRCARHHDWAKLALDDVRFEMSENSEIMRGLDREEKDIMQRAGLRARVMKAGGAGGEVELNEAEEEQTDGENAVPLAADDMSDEATAADRELESSAPISEGIAASVTEVAESTTTEQPQQHASPTNTVTPSTTGTVDTAIVT